MSITPTDTRSCRYCDVKIPYTAGDGGIRQVDFLCSHHLELFNQWQALASRPPFVDYLRDHPLDTDEVSFHIPQGDRLRLPKATFSSGVDGGRLTIVGIREQVELLEFMKAHSLEVIVKRKKKKL